MRDVWVGTCPACQTAVLVDDDYVRRGRQVLHRECELYEEGVIDRELLAEVAETSPR